jgi:hypothetical protein
MLSVWKHSCKFVVGTGYEDSSYGGTTAGYDRYLYPSDAGIRRLLSVCVINNEAFYVEAHLRPQLRTRDDSCSRSRGR